MRSPEIQNAESDTDAEGFQLEVNEVAELLGVTRTRVSQLTSAGQLSFERRRVGTRNRLFYKRSEVLAHQRGFYGRQMSSAQQQLISRLTDSDEFAAQGDRIGATAQFRTLESFPSYETVSSALLHRIEEQNQHNRRQLAKIVEMVANASTMSRTSGAALVSADSLRNEDNSAALTQSLVQEVCRLAEQLSLQQSLLLDVIESSRSIKKDLHQILNYQFKTDKPPAHKGLITLSREQEPPERGQRKKPELRRARSVGKRKVFQR
jgi:cell pole-organizing protein PopZ